MNTLSLRASDFEPGHRVAAFQDAVSSMCKLDITPADPETFQSHTEIGLLPTLMTGQTMHSACTVVRTPTLAAETGDNIMLHVPVKGAFSMHQRGGQDVVCGPGQIYVDPNEMPGIAEFGEGRTEVFYVSIPRGCLQSSARGLNAVMRDTAAMTPQWRLFLRYAQSLHAELRLLPPDQALQCAAHVQDLVVMALGAANERMEIARGRGVRAARLKAIRDDIEQHLTSTELSVDWMAARHGISQRYIRSLFAGEETTFRDYVAVRRLRLVHRMLTDPACSGLTVSEIAMSAGFGDLSWFNNCFRRTYGRTPSDIRAEALAVAFSRN
ncbi:AraC family transcriptional regulator [Nitratireductor indicus C115]|uniref:AraC family transcriptional regulator n=1 Tax=Nitratireductor indicus C115 TaxID=1231190 RepID=K2N3D3_9HYPH|nr:AraC family transcriptional regulator [Nitratireductor indicus]EKF41928.1 AraC family transcriptional regulator [Nitratireductor indicus C115]SFQ48119.1 AraC-type DNA-binding protein [Nitratireductor indicus]